MDKVQSSDTDRFSKCASIVVVGCERDRDACAYDVPQLAKSASVWKGSMEGQGRRKKIKKMNEKRKTKIKEDRFRILTDISKPISLGKPQKKDREHER